jgi:protoporphyrin/coproporphyrin ferrochelatase
LDDLAMGEPGPVGVLLMAMGGPDSLESVEPYLLDVRGGRPTPPELVAEIRERYRLTGGKSPVLDITRELAGKLEERLNGAEGPPFRVAVGLRHWQPRIAQAWRVLVEEKPQRIVGLCMAPQYSGMTVAKYVEKLEEARAEVGGDVPVSWVRSWNRHPRLVAALAGAITEALERFPAGGREAVPVLFTAHSLPERILGSGDAYPAEVAGTMEAVYGRLRELRDGRPLVARLAYQSQGRSPEPWLGPAVEEVLEELAAEGSSGVVVAPVGFVSDHVETLYDIDIDLRARAVAMGLRLERMAMLNASPPMVDTLTAVIDEHLAETP